MVRALRPLPIAVLAVLATLAALLPAVFAPAQQPAADDPLASIPLAEPSPIALPIAENRGQAALDESLKRLSTSASLMMIVAHPDDEDGTLLTYLSRSLGVRCTLLTLTRGEGGQNAMSADSYDALGLIRTNELLKADEYYGARQLWGTEIDFGFSKTQEEAFARWGHDRVLYDAVLAVRRERPQVIVSTFVGGVTDGHGHHQVSGEIAQEVFKAAADPTVFPEQLKPVNEGGLGLTIWQPLAVYSMVPFARIENGKMFDYATGKWAPAKFKNYVTGEWTEDAPSTDVTIQVGARDPAIGRSYAQIAREGWGMQKSQNGGANPTFSGPASTYYHLWAVAPQSAAKPGATTINNDLFHNSRVNIDTSIAGLARVAGSTAPEWLTVNLSQIDAGLIKILGSALGTSEARNLRRAPGAPRPDSGTSIDAGHPKQMEEPTGAPGPDSGTSETTNADRGTQALKGHDFSRAANATRDAGASAPEGNPLSSRELDLAHSLAPIYGQAISIRSKVATSTLDPQSKASLLFELDTKIDQYQAALKNLLGLDLVAFTTHATKVEEGGFRGGGPDETPRSVSPGQDFNVRIHTAHAAREVHLEKTWLASAAGASWQQGEPVSTHPTDTADDAIFKLHVPSDAQPTQPYFTRPNTEQAFYDLTQPQYRERSFVPWPLAAWAEFTFEGLPIRVGQVVQTMHRVLGPGGIYEPLVVTPAIGVSVDPQARILPLDGSSLPVEVTVHAQSAAEGTVDLKLPDGWTAQPHSAPFHLSEAGDTDPILFSVTPAATESGSYVIKAIARTGDPTIPCNLSSATCYSSGWQSIGYPGLRPYNLYTPAQLQTRKVDVKLAPGLRIGYVMGTGDLVPDAIEALGATPHLLTPAELASADLSAWNVIVIGIRAYSNRPELARAQPRLNEFVRSGGTLIVQYQSASFPAPLPLTMGRAERVVDEAAPVKLLAPANPLLTSPNTIASADFDGWLEERGHSFLESWDTGFTALTETADPGQDPQRGGLLIAHPGKGTYIYVSYALYRQLPELVPGAYRILANLLSAGK